MCVCLGLRWIQRYWNALNMCLANACKAQCATQVKPCWTGLETVCRRRREDSYFFLSCFLGSLSYLHSSMPTTKHISAICRSPDGKKKGKERERKTRHITRVQGPIDVQSWNQYLIHQHEKSITVWNLFQCNMNSKVDSRKKKKVTFDGKKPSWNTSDKPQAAQARIWASASIGIVA